MKIGIVTLYDALNYGAFLQAYALQEFLTHLGHEIEFININTPANNKIKYRKLLSKNYKVLIFNIHKYLSFRRSLTRMRVAKKKNNINREYYDAVILGSDEIWNLINPSFEHLAIYFGNGISSKNIITYAPSCGNTKIEQIRNDVNAQKGLNIIKNFSARDENSADIIEALTGKKVTLVLDPTLLLGTFNQLEEKNALKGYILVYTYGFNANKVKRVKEFARTKNLKTVSAGFYYKWCDVNLPVSPFIFLTLVKNADYVITDTYHATLLSIIYQKRFGVFAEGKTKVESILKQLDLVDRIVDEDKDIEFTIDKEIDYPRVDSILVEKRKQSIEYLSNALDCNNR